MERCKDGVCNGPTKHQHDHPWGSIYKCVWCGKLTVVEKEEEPPTSSGSDCSDLLPCPFCGEKPDQDVRVGENSRTGKWHVIECINPNCLEVVTHEATIKEARTAWNTRAR